MRRPEPRPLQHKLLLWSLRAPGYLRLAAMVAVACALVLVPVPKIRYLSIQPTITWAIWTVLALAFAGPRRRSTAIAEGALIGLAHVYWLLLFRAQNGCTGVSASYTAALEATTVVLFGLMPAGLTPPASSFAPDSPAPR